MAPEKGTKVWRWFMGVLTALGATVGLAVLKVALFIGVELATFHSKVLERFDKLKARDDAHEKNDESQKTIFKQAVKQNSEAIDFHSQQISALQSQTNGNTSAITSINATIEMIQDRTHK